MFLFDLINELCLKKDITVTQLCRECDIPRSTLTDLKKGRIKSLSMNNMCKIADFFEVSVGYLCGSPMTVANEEALKTLLFGEGVVVSDEMWNEVKEYAKFIKEKHCR